MTGMDKENQSWPSALIRTKTPLKPLSAMDHANDLQSICSTKEVQIQERLFDLQEYYQYRPWEIDQQPQLRKQAPGLAQSR